MLDRTAIEPSQQSFPFSGGPFVLCAQVVEAALRNESLASLTPSIVDYLEGRRRRGGPTKPGQRSARIMRLGRHGLRHKNVSFSAVEKIIANWNIDIYMSTVLQTLHHIGRLPIQPVAPVPLAAQFSVETVYDATTCTPTGVHKPYRFLNASQMRRLVRNCPPMHTLLKYTAAEHATSDVRLLPYDLQRLAALAEASH